MGCENAGAFYNHSCLALEGGGNMNRDFEYLEDKDIVLLKTSGSYDLTKELDTVREIASKFKEYDCNRCLIDYRKTNIIAETADIYDRPEVYTTLGYEKSIQVAIVVEELNAAVRFYETVCQNRGWCVRAFDDYNAGIDWLSK